MKANVVPLIALCVSLTCCGVGPSAGQIEAALNEAVKAKNPEATARVTSVVDTDNNPYYVDFTFTCTNCVFQFKDGTRNVVPSSEGHGMVTLSSKINRWKFDRIVLVSEGLGQVIYESDHIF